MEINSKVLFRATLTLISTKLNLSLLMKLKNISGKLWLTYEP